MKINEQWDRFIGLYENDKMDKDNIYATSHRRINEQLDSLYYKNESYLDITNTMIDDAKQWSNNSNIIMMYPTEDLDNLYNRYLDQTNDNKRKADWKAMELYGMDNEQLYIMLKNNHTSIINISNDDNNYSLSNKLIDIETQDSSSFIESAYKKYNEGKIINKINSNFKNDTIKWEFIYAPYFNPNEIIQLEGFYSNNVSPKCIEIFNEYRDYYYGYNNNFNIMEWNNEIDKINHKIKLESNSQNINNLKQDLIMLGWNPEIQYTPENQIKAKQRLENIINESYKGFKLYNLNSLYQQFIDTDDTPIAESAKDALYPVHIVLVKGSSLFSNVTTKVTNGPFSHAAICTTNNFDKLYSFNMNTGNKKGGLSLESIKNYPSDNRLGVYSFFIKKEQWEKLNNNIQYMVDNIKNTSYSFLNILALPFSNINLNMPESLICSQFVDKMLKLSNINITNISSDKVTPNYLYDTVIKNSKVYKIYDGKVKDFNNNKINKFINSIKHNAKRMDESGILVDIKNEYSLATISEARLAPIQFSDNGDLLISKPDSVIDLNAEYFNSHKLLIEYGKSNNMNGMKYELCRLYFINYILEKRIYSNKFSSNKSDYIKTRARVLNDFNKYLKIVLAKDNNFNFAKYYEDSPFYHNTIEVKNTTLSSIKKIINSIL